MDWKKPQHKVLVEALLVLETPDEMRYFLRDLLTENEIKEFANRLRAAEMLSAKRPYSEIETATGLSSTTVARVSKWLKGAGGGYKTVLHRLHRGKPSKAGH